MKKSELKKRLIEALTPDEAAKVEPKYKETYAAMIKGKGPLKLKKYDNPDKVVRGRVVNTIKNESLKIAEKLGKTADVGDYKDDFRKSDAPQFKGKSKKKRDQMATAAFLNKEDLDVGHQDDEPRMIKKDIYNMGKYAMEIYKKLDQYDDMEGEVDFPHWWQSKITKAKSMLQSAYDYLDGEERISQIDAIMQEEVTDKEENKLKKIKKELNKASKMHKGQADRIGKIVDEDAKEKSEKNYSNYFKKMDKNRLEEFVKAALMGPMNETSTDKYDDNPALKGKQSDLPDALQKGILGLEEDNVDETEVNLTKMMDFAKLAKKVKDATEFIEKVASQLGNQSPEGEKALTSMYNSLKTMEESESTIDEIAPIKDYPGQIKNTIKANVKSVKTFGDEILRHIDAVKAEEPQGDQYVDNPKLKMAIKNLKSFDLKKESLSERILKELRK